MPSEYIIVSLATSSHLQFWIETDMTGIGRRGGGDQEREGPKLKAKREKHSHVVLTANLQSEAEKITPAKQITGGSTEPIKTITPDKARESLFAAATAFQTGPRSSSSRCRRKRFDIKRSMKMKRPMTTGTPLSLTGKRYVPRGVQHVNNPYLKKPKIGDDTNPVKVAAECAVTQKGQLADIKRRAELVENKIIQACPICRSKSCDGECTVSCYVCGNGHWVRQCRYNKKATLGKEVNRYLKDNGVCILCCMPNDSRGVHGVSMEGELLCPGQKRFRAIIRDRLPRQQLTYGQYVRKLHASRKSYYNYLVNGGFED